MNKDIIEVKDKLYLFNTILQEVKPLKLRKKIYCKIIEYFLITVQNNSFNNEI